MKTKVKLFICYAHNNRDIVSRFREQLSQHLNVSKHFDYSIWWDDNLLCGEAWNEEIKETIATCDAGLLLLSPHFLNSKFILTEEIPHLKKEGKLLFPVALYPLDFEFHDLQGIDEKQIFMLHNEDFKQPRSYYKLKPARREDFVLSLFRQIEERFIKEFKKKESEKG